MPEPRKQCTACFRSLPADAFYWDYRIKQGKSPIRRSKCIECYIQAQIGRNQANLERTRVYHRQWRAKRGKS